MSLLESMCGTISTLGFSPEQQLLHYAWPCLQTMGRRVNGKHLAELRQALEAGTHPRRRLLRFVFPNAYRGLRSAAARLNQETWSQAAVERYFLVDHNDPLVAAARGIPNAFIQLCQVKLATVTTISDGKCDVVLADGKTDWAENPTNLPLAAEMTVAVHRRAVVDILRPDCLG